MKRLFFISIIILLASCNKKLYKTKVNLKNKKIVIIGAGISGLSAANYFKTQGINTIVLEAHGSVGGRLRTNRSSGMAFDEGASWIHGPKGNPITALTTLAGANTFLTDDDNVSVYDTNGIKYSDSILNNAESEYTHIIKKIKGHENKSFGEVFYNKYPEYKNNPLWTYMLSSFLEFDTGADIYNLSSKDYYNDEEFSGEDLIITNGFDKVTNYLKEGLNIKLNTIVNSIDYSTNNISISTSKGYYNADYVLVTVPLGVLKKNVIKFYPKLSLKTQNAINHLEMGTVNKFLLTWEKPFWDTDKQYIGYTPQVKGKYNYFLNVKKFSNKNALITFAFGNYSVKSEQMTDEQVIEEIMSHLKSIYGKNIPNPTNMLRTKWNSNPYTFGSYSFATNNSKSNEFEIFEEPIDNKVFFAGEHTSVEYRGTVHGAYLSGIREAKKIIKNL